MAIDCVVVALDGAGMVTSIVVYCNRLSVSTAAMFVRGNKSTNSVPELYANLKLTANLFPPYCISILIGNATVGAVWVVVNTIFVPLMDMVKVLYSAYCSSLNVDTGKTLTKLLAVKPTYP